MHRQNQALKVFFPNHIALHRQGFWTNSNVIKSIFCYIYILAVCRELIHLYKITWLLICVWFSEHKLKGMDRLTCCRRTPENSRNGVVMVFFIMYGQAGTIRVKRPQENGQEIGALRKHIMNITFDLIMTSCGKSDAIHIINFWILSPRKESVPINDNVKKRKKKKKMLRILKDRNTKEFLPCVTD